MQFALIRLYYASCFILITPRYLYLESFLREGFPYPNLQSFQVKHCFCLFNFAKKQTGISNPLDDKNYMMTNITSTHTFRESDFLTMVSFSDKGNNLSFLSFFFF